MSFVVILLIILTFLSRIIGLGREITLAYFYGTSNISDAYLMSIAIPTIIITFVITSLATSYIPAYQKIESGHMVENVFTNKVMGLTFTICLLILVVTMRLTPQIVPLFVAGFDEATMGLTITFTRITLFAIFFMGINHVLHSFLQVKEKVLLASLSGLPFNLVSIIFITLSAYTSTYMLAIGTIIAIGSQSVYLLTLAKRQGFKLKPHLDVKDNNIRNIILLTMPIILSNTALQIGIIVDKNLASTFGHGAVSALTYSTRVSTAISGIVITSVLVVTFPKISKLAVDGNIIEMKNALSESVVNMSLLIIPAIIAVAMFSTPIVSLLFERGAFDSDAVSVTSSLLFFYIFFLFGDGITQLISRVFYALGDSKTPMMVAIVTVMLNILLSFAFVHFMGISGLALATSLSAFVGMLILMFLLRRKIGSLRLQRTLISLKKIFGAAIVCVFGAYFVYQYLVTLNATIALLIAGIVGIAIYGLLVLVLRIREVDILIAFIFIKVRSLIAKMRRN